MKRGHHRGCNIVLVLVLGFFDYEYEDDDENDSQRALQTYLINKYKIAF